MTGYGLLALTSASRLGEAFQAVRWLLERSMGCSGNGGDCRVLKGPGVFYRGGGVIGEA